MLERQRKKTMKRYGRIYDKITDKETILLAILQASKGKTDRKPVKLVLDNIEHYINEIQIMLICGEFEPSRVKTHKIFERKKERLITTTPFYPDQIIHWATMLVIQPILLSGMYEYTLATIKGRGISLGKKMAEKWIRSDFKNTKYCLKMDVHKFYNSIDHEILKLKLKRKFKDEQLLNLLFKIIDSYEVGLPLGLYTSQWLANFYLSELDHRIKNDWGGVYLLRYMDDIVVFGPNKKKLHKIHHNIHKWLLDNKLKQKPNWQVFKTSSRPLDFLGVKIYRTHTTLRRANSLKIRRRAKKISKKSSMSEQDARTIIAYWGWIKSTNSYTFYNKNIKPYASIKSAKRILSKINKGNNIT